MNEWYDGFTICIYLENGDKIEGDDGGGEG